MTAALADDVLSALVAVARDTALTRAAVSGDVVVATDGCPRRLVKQPGEE